MLPWMRDRASTEERLQWNRVARRAAHSGAAPAQWVTDLPWTWMMGGEGERASTGIWA